jgi:hypothetical protein
LVSIILHHVPSSWCPRGDEQSEGWRLIERHQSLCHLGRGIKTSVKNHKYDCLLILLISINKMFLWQMLIICFIAILGLRNCWVGLDAAKRK